MACVLRKRGQQGHRLENYRTGIGSHGFEKLRTMHLVHAETISKEDTIEFAALSRPRDGDEMLEVHHQQAFIIPRIRMTPRTDYTADGRGNGH